MKTNISNDGAWRAWLLSCFAIAGAFHSSAAGSEPISLAGPWRFQLDRNDAGVAEKWFERALPDKIKLPGTLTAQGIGDGVTVDTKWIGGIVDKSWFTAPEYAKYRQPGNVKVPFWLQPDKQYAGAAWYQRDIEIPKAWEGKRVVLTLERPHWETRVWMDSKLIGSNNALATPHDYEISPLSPGKHQLTIRVDNRMVVDVGENSHSVSDHMQGNWNGIVGKIELRATPPVWIEDVQVFPNVAKKSAHVKVTVGNATGKAGRGTLSVGAKNVEATWDVIGGQAEVEMDMSDAKLWDEFAPNLSELTVKLGNDQRTVRFGLREITAQGTQFTINGRKVFIRGTLDCCTYPKTGHPPTDVTEWKRIIGVAKAHGLNLIRFHSWCPPEAAFVAADELGFYFHVEASSWANQSTTLGDGKPVDQWVYDETDRILKYYGNHPSFVLMPYGNEPGGPKHKEYLAKWVKHYKAKDPRRLWTSGAGWPELPENQWHCDPHPRIQAWGGGLKSRINAKPPETRTDYRDYTSKRTVPVVSHEIGQWCVYPNFDEMNKYTGYLKPRNFEIFRDRLREHHMSDLARKFLLASGKLQTLCYKEDIESALRTPGMGGFELLDLHDFPGQGTALVGVLDPFWEEKGYVTSAEYSRFCNATVPLARLGKRVFTTDEKLETDIEVAHFGRAPLENAVTTWKLVNDDGKVVASGELSAKTIPVNNGTALGSVSVELKNVPAPALYKLVVSVEGFCEMGSAATSAAPVGALVDRNPAAGRVSGEGAGHGTRGRVRSPFENDWDVWVYPPKTDMQPSQDVKIVDDLNADALAALDAGGKVLLMIPPKRVKNAAKDKVVLGFSSIFWNTAWTRRQPPTTLGILCDPKHPALADFPTDYHSNWQWWYLVSRAGAMILDDLPRELKPIVHVIDDWFTARKLGLVFEAKLGKGKLLVCSVDLKEDLDENPVARQMRSSLLRYMASDRFNPKVAVTKEAIARLMISGPGSELARLDAKIWVDSEDDAHGNIKDNAIDGDPQTFWHTQWQPSARPMPHWLVVDLGRELPLAGITYLPRQDQANGRIAEAEISCSNEPKKWGAPVATVKWLNTADRQTVRFAKPVTARYLKLVPKSEVRGQPFAAVAELDIVTEGR
ncbi:MAG: discoidin domain-containing protein [Verrucomicrobia bacterium]|nr:discoidin domain-containing protein [Verrucomicrobiota bacterium]